jgi:autotransporter adhesin
MNKSYRSIWNEALGAWVAASELTKGRGKKSSSRVLAVAAVALAVAGQAAGGGLDGGTGGAAQSAYGPSASTIAVPSGSDAIAIGNEAVVGAATATDAITLGTQLNNSARSGILVGNNFVALDTGSVRSVVFAPDGLAIGGTAGAYAQPVTGSSDSFVYVSGRSVNQVSSSPGAVAIGGSVLNATDGVAIGTNSSTTYADGVALGSGSKTAATLAGLAAAYDPSGTAVGKTPVGELSVGNAAGAKRQITNVAAGGADTDAVNVSQLKATDTKVTNLSTTVNSVVNGAGIKYFHANSAGVDSQATGAESVAVGPQAVATAVNGVALGRLANASGSAIR